MLGVDEGGDTARLLRLRNCLKREGGFAGRLGSEDLDDTAAGETTDAKRPVDADRSGGNRGDGCDRVGAAEPHDRALPELFFDLADRQFDRLYAFFVRSLIAAVFTFTPIKSIDALWCGHLIASSGRQPDDDRRCRRSRCDSRSVPENCQAKMQTVKSVSIASAITYGHERLSPRSWGL